MTSDRLTEKLMSSPASSPSMARLENGSRVAVMGGGPAGSLFSYFLLTLAGRSGLELSVDIYEPRDFSQPAPQGCNMCAGVISESLVQYLAADGINLPPTVVQKAVDSYVLHTDTGSLRLATPSGERRIGVIFRGGGPRGIREVTRHSFDGYLLSMAAEKGAHVIPTRITDVQRTNDRIQIRTKETPPETYDLLAVGVGVNTAALRLFENQQFNYEPPGTTKTALREYHLGAEVVERYLGNSLHVFLLDVPGFTFGMAVPKGDYASLAILGRNVDNHLVEAVASSREVKNCFPPEWQWDRPSCHCMPRIPVSRAIRPYSDRLVFMGDCGVSRLYKDGVGAAYRAAKAASSTAVFAGISREDFRRHYEPACRALDVDNRVGRVIFAITRLIQKTRFSRAGLIQMASEEQARVGQAPRMSSVLWDTFTGSAPYKDIFLRSLHPAFLSRYVWSMAEGLLGS